MTTKKEYQKPTMKVVPLKRQQQLLAGSDPVPASMPNPRDEQNI